MIDSYHQIIPGVSQHLYPTLTANSSVNTPVSNDCHTLHNQIISKLDKYLQEAAEKHEAEDNYYDGCHKSTNTSSTQQEDSYLDGEEANTDINTKPSTPESHQKDTGFYQPSPSDDHNQSQEDQEELATIPEEEVDPADQDTLLFETEESDEE